ncbi:MAG: hypothetical protein NTV94_06320 [Planctomycetota bacterium]|nr:hypothetical protein [Planctomycetota bacterium]
MDKLLIHFSKKTPSRTQTGFYIQNTSDDYYTCRTSSIHEDLLQCQKKRISHEHFRLVSIYRTCFLPNRVGSVDSWFELASASSMSIQTKSNHAELMELPSGLWSAARSQMDRQWFIIRTRSRQEKKLAADLAARRISCFLPLVAEVRYHGRRKARVIVPLFPGYLFLVGTREEAFAADRSGRSAQLIEVPDQERLHNELTAIVRILQTGGSLTPCTPLVRGTLVEVSSGPFKGIRGTVDMNLRDNRLVLNVDLIGKAAVLEIDRDLLRLV